MSIFRVSNMYQVNKYFCRNVQNLKQWAYLLVVKVNAPAVYFFFLTRQHCVHALSDSFSGPDTKHKKKNSRKKLKLFDQSWNGVNAVNPNKRRNTHNGNPPSPRRVFYYNKCIHLDHVVVTDLHSWTCTVSVRNRGRSNTVVAKLISLEPSRSARVSRPP